MSKSRRTLAAVLSTVLLGAGGSAMAGPLPQGTDLLLSGRPSPFAGKTLAQKVQELADRAELEDLVGVYAHRAALGVNISDLFTDDGALIAHIPGGRMVESRGRAALEKSYGGVSNRIGKQLPMVHNQVLAISGDEATGLVSVEVRGDDNGDNMLASGYYMDNFRRVNGQWKFVKREVYFHHYTTLAKGWVGTPTSRPEHPVRTPARTPTPGAH